ncbi:hypothetical protein J437_LFUL004271 [Ladona fulva]|uniref:Uncharacterized protein n=1 Tax=Ladona fulva TaxID=123851 RepID=A0A8K0KDT4_LADFU|nr:hypothetical protein J437_LFUL004271 [Ladona fulva]
MLLQFCLLLHHVETRCGPRLIVKGFTIFTQFGELSPSEILSVFQEFISWPEYSTSSFLPSMHTTLLKKYVDLNKDDGDEHDLESVEENLDDDSQTYRHGFDL